MTVAVRIDEAAIDEVQKRPVGQQKPFDPWTASEAEAWAEDRACAANDRRRTGVIPPIGQYIFAQLARTDRDRVEAGDGVAIMSALAYCASGQLRIPNWLGLPFIERFDKAEHEFNSWDKAFGLPLRRKGVNLKARARRLALGQPILDAVEAARKTGMKMDEALFEQVGERFGIKKTLCAKIYYETRTAMDFRER